MENESFKPGTPDPEVTGDRATREPGQEFCADGCGAVIWPDERKVCENAACGHSGCVHCLRQQTIELVRTTVRVYVCGDECLADWIEDAMADRIAEQAILSRQLAALVHGTPKPTPPLPGHGSFHDVTALLDWAIREMDVIHKKIAAKNR